MSTPTPGGFSLFPSPNMSKPPSIARNQTPKGRRSESRERRAATPQGRRAASPPAIPPEPSFQMSPPRTGRQTPQHRTQPSVELEPIYYQQEPGPAAAGSSSQQERWQDVQVQQPRPVADVPGRAETAFSQAQTLVRGNSTRSRSSIAKLPIYDEPSSSDQQPVRSIFPTYNPDVPLEQQHYVPTQMSPTHIPRAVISRQTYYEGSGQDPPLRSPLSAGIMTVPRRPQDPPVVPETCTTDQLKPLWKVANGWQASSSEGRVYCLKMAQEKDSPVYTLSSTTQPFYNLRLDPTSTSAHVTMMRHDPSKTYKAPKSDPSASTTSILSMVTGGVGGKMTESKHWQEAISTTLEEESRKTPPNDGLVALLMPTPASKMAIEKADDPSSVMMAERECARLVWDADSANHFLVHPALATPFCITIERSPAWSRVEYTLEHHESPMHLAKLTRDGTGSGWLEIDTGIAAKIESFYIIDVAVTALLLVAQSDEKNAPALEMFEPPPPLLLSEAEQKRLSRASKKEEKKRRKMEPFEIDLESQPSSLGKSKVKDDEWKLPLPIRAIVAVIKALFACFIWVLTIFFKCFAGIFKGMYRCVGSKY